jgi:two-component system cell cycle sensor histidine kinase/response regulator CckA
MSPRILIVDDEEVNLLTLEAFLTADGYKLHFARDGRSAITLAREIHPDLILLDVMMPELDGFAVCREIRADPVIGRIPLILITALDDSSSRLEGLKAGAEEFLSKPCDRAELRARVQTIISLNRFRALAEERIRFERLYELSPAAIVLTDQAGQILTANRAAEACFGQDRPLSGSSLTTHFPPAAAATLHDALAAAPGPDSGHPVDVACGEGEGRRHFSVRLASVPEGLETRIMLVFDDLTAEVRAREALQKLNAGLEDIVSARTKQLEDANALLVSYASFVSHDLRSPLTVIKGYLGLLNEMAPEMPAPSRPMVAQAFQASHTMTEMIGNILQLAHDIHEGDTGPREAVDPEPVLRRLISHVRQVAPNPKAAFVVHGPLPAVGVTAVLIERVFFNLLTNAAKYSAEQAQPVIEIGTTGLPGEPVLFVRDNGVGFDAGDSNRLFQEFSRLATAGKTEGLGLGLSLVARLVRSQGGKIWAESTVGRGATFFVQVPAPATPAGLAALAATAR